MCVVTAPHAQRNTHFTREAEYVHMYIYILDRKKGKSDRYTHIDICSKNTYIYLNVLSPRGL